MDLDRYEAASRLLPEDLYLLAHRPSGRLRIGHDGLAAGLAAAVLAELRLRGRVRLADSEEATVVVDDPSPTGDPLLDEVLARVAGEQPLPRWRAGWTRRPTTMRTPWRGGPAQASYGR